MQLKVTTDYAIRIVLYTATKNALITSGELSEKLGIPKSVILKLGRTLSASGIMDVSTGAKGGFKIKKSPETISLFDIIDLFEPTTKINRCLEEDQYCTRFATATCPVRAAYCDIQTELERKLKSITIGSMLGN